MGSVAKGIGNFLGAGTGATGFNVNSAAFAPNAQEQGFTNRLIELSQGQGPSVAQAQMQEGLDQSNQQALALAASQRGINAGLAARLAAVAQGQNNQANNQQLGVLRAQEQLGANSQLGQELQSQRGGRMAEQTAQLGSHEGAAGRASNTISTIGTGITSYLGKGAYNGGLIEPERYAVGGAVTPLQVPVMQLDPATSFAQALGTQVGQMMAKGQSLSDQGTQNFKAALGPRQKTAQPAPPSLFDQDIGVLDQSVAPGVGGIPASGFQNALLAAQGGSVPGRAKVLADSPANDTVPAVLSPGEIVLPRSVVEAGPNAAKNFVAALMKQQRRA
jgi:hypothetical protein